MATPAEQYEQPRQPSPPSQQQGHGQQYPQHAYYELSQKQYSPRSSKPRTFSFHSHHTPQSRRQSRSGNPDYYETHEEKESRRLHTKADPSLAIIEAEPSTVAAMTTETSLVPLRSIQHKDTWGNPIADPDKSNPTRNRWERPLDTIRSFEAAIDGGYSRKSMHRADTDSAFNGNHRGSYQPQGQSRYPQDNYYACRPMSYNSYGTNRHSYYDHQAYGGAYQNGRSMPRERTQRNNSEPHYRTYGQEQNVYPMPYRDRSYETVTSAVPSGNSETDPTSSDNSSIDRTSLAKRQDAVNDYGIGFTQPQSYSTANFSPTLAQPDKPASPPPPAVQPAQKNEASATAPPRKRSLLKRQASSQPRQDGSDKRKSWFSRRFSKST
ncbi:uncharacterized protein DCS_07971 [Drechmeria coniospora]|uniref:DUF2406 domain protein n=1 Tax=Drechmeria coniospora TaxID=98403 RepID=A0A151GG15_DRECN|nr:uncharacterized protein DCS_07971 [Drechmeria coniospora]KYK56006.1 uncharacterized protein DCS_07971 [Drechmeria coniospora]